MQTDLNEALNKETREFKKGTNKLLSDAIKKLKKIGWEKLRILKDEKGVFCIEYPKFYLTANSYLYKKHILSSQKEIIYRTKKHMKKLVVYVGENEKFYIFNPEDILMQHWENQHGYLTMYNWNVNLGKEFLN